MNRKYIFRLGLLLLLFTACRENPTANPEEDEEPTLPCLFNMNRSFTPEEFNISFPLWFNDSLIRKHKIETLTRNLYSNSVDIDTTDLSLRESKVYTFNEAGKLIGLYIEHYYDHTLVGSMSFTFSKHDEVGYAEVQSRKEKILRSDQEILSQYRRYTKEKYADKYLVFKEQMSGDRLFFMLRKKHWGSLSVDSILNPSRRDMIVLGTPKKPHKRYKVENRVNESEVVEYSYAEGLLKRISFDRYPFHYERSLTFDRKGQCTGFIDSTFSNKKYLTRRESTFQMKKGIPVRMIHETKSSKSATGYYQMETFEYSYFEKN